MQAARWPGVAAAAQAPRLGRAPRPQTLHSAGIVHRDIKPANIVFDERRRRFRLIDLGAAACLRTGTNYKPGETILDPCYCPPEEVGAGPGRQAGACQAKAA